MIKLCKAPKLEISHVTCILANMSSSAIFAREHAVHLDSQDPLKHLRSLFIIPSKKDLKAKCLFENSEGGAHDEPSIYLCGNSLGCQPKGTSQRVSEHLTAWAKKGVLGHFTTHNDCDLAGFLDIDHQAANMMEPIVGALPDEVAIMETLTANLHLMMASFYRPKKERYKIILEGKAFPSDHYAVQSQIKHHGFDPKEAMITIEPEIESTPTLSTEYVLSSIDQHASTTALILLPGVQYYTGQYLDIRKITAHAHAHGIMIGWDLAHAVGNVELSLHEWDVDFAVWCNYKYLNAGPGSIAGLFVHDRHGKTHHAGPNTTKDAYRPRLAGWWGGDKSIRFQMGREFVPIPGAQGFQVGNPSSLAVTSLIASLDVFQKTSMAQLRKKSMALTRYLEQLLVDPHFEGEEAVLTLPYKIITPADPASRGAQLSVRLNPGLLDIVLVELEHASIVIDERKPDVVRVAPTPLYNTFQDVWEFARVFTAASVKALAETTNGH